VWAFFCGYFFGWKLEAGSWKLEAGSWKLEAKDVQRELRVKSSNEKSPYQNPVWAFCSSF